MLVDSAIRLDNDQLSVSGPITFDNAAEINRVGSALIHAHTAATIIVNLAAIEEVDSSAVSLLLEWVRVAQAQAISIRFIQFPANLTSLITLYGVSGLIPADSISPSASSVQSG